MMAKESAQSLTGGGSLEAIGAAAQRTAAGAGAPPLHLWDPPFCGDIDMRIARDGTWFYGGTPIGRPALVRLFASILRHDPDGIMLVTPVEKVRITVEDAPFVAVEMAVEAGPTLAFRTNVGDWVTAEAAHPLQFRPAAAGGIKPYLTVRPGLEALVTRALFFDLVERSTVSGEGPEATVGVMSAGMFFPIAPASALREAM